MAAPTLFFPAAIIIDSSPLTDQGRAPVTKSRDERSVVVELANGTRKRYIKAVKYTFTTSWSWLPDAAVDTIDGYAARQDMAELFNNGDTHLLQFYDRNAGWVEHTVFVASYDENLIRRDASTGGHFWNVTVSFEEA